MWPILLSLGPVKIFSYGVCLTIGLFFGLYFWWKMGRDEHFDEIALFDAFFLSVFSYFVIGRVGYVLLHFGELGTLYRAIAVLAYPGMSSVVGVVGVIIFMILFARAHEWDGWKVMDALSVTISFVLIMAGIGGLLNGSNPGYPAKMGIVYPGDSITRFPVDVWIIIWSIITFAIVSKVRKNFRFYSWYKGESSSVQEGLASLIWGGLVGIYYLVVGWMRQPMGKLGPIPYEVIVGVLMVGIAVGVIYRHTGRRDGGMWGKLVGIIRRK